MKYKEEMEIDLSGIHWKMQRIRPGQGVLEGFQTMASEYQGTFFNWNQAQVPGDVFTDLQRAGEIDDPYFGRNFGRAKWVQEYEYWYFTKFHMPEEMMGKRISLFFEGVDYSCEVWLNGQYLGGHEGMFSSFEFDITNTVRFDEWYQGCNIVMIKLDPPPRNHARVMGRKFCFGGDYMPDVAPFGIHRPVKVRATGDAAIKHVRIESTIADADATVSLEVEMNSLCAEPLAATITAAISGENFDSITPLMAEAKAVLAPGRNVVQLAVPVADAKLWWPWDIGEQHLYQAEVSVEVDGDLHDSRCEVFGIREIAMERNPGFSEDEVEFPWTFVINGKRQFLRAACWGGPPSMLYGRNTDEKYETRLQMVREANINNLRIFGWHPPEAPYFYELCDRLGITVWTNFSFATQGYTASPELLGPAVAECVEIVKQRRNHPSTIMWMGGEEVFFSNAHVESDNKLIMEEIGVAVEQVTNVPYAIASPLSGRFGQKLGYKPKESAHANEHYYAAGAMLMEEYYPTQDYCVIPELTAASAPGVESLKRFIPEDELWPIGLSWGYHWADIDILKTLNVEVFGDECTGSLEEFVTATQIAQGRIFQYALEHYRRRKPRVSAVALCHFMTHMPDIKWGLIDYYGEKKLSYAYVQRAYQPLLASVEYTRRRWNPGECFAADLWTVNDLHERLDDMRLSWEIRHDDAVVTSGEQALLIEANSSQSVLPIEWTVDGDRLNTFDVAVTLADAGGEVRCENFHTLLIDDHHAAKAVLKERFRANVEKLDIHGRSYYRFFPEQMQFD